MKLKLKNRFNSMAKLKILFIRKLSIRISMKMIILVRKSIFRFYKTLLRLS
jgi:hypothetical protein